MLVDFTVTTDGVEVDSQSEVEKKGRKKVTSRF